MKCPFCGAQIADDCLFCTECGKELPKGNVCPHCGASVNEDDVFCTECGKRIDEVSPITTSEPIKPKCPHCGTSMNEGDVFCTECGKKIDDVQAESTEEELPTKESPNDISENDALVEDSKETSQEEEKEEEPRPIQQETSPIEEVEDNDIAEEYEEQPSLIKKYLPFVIGGILVLALIGYCSSKDSKSGDDSQPQTEIADSVATDNDTPIADRGSVIADYDDNMVYQGEYVFDAVLTDATLEKQETTFTIKIDGNKVSIPSNDGKTMTGFIYKDDLGIDVLYDYGDDLHWITMTLKPNDREGKEWVGNYGFTGRSFDAVLKLKEVKRKGEAVKVIEERTDDSDEDISNDEKQILDDESNINVEDDSKAWYVYGSLKELQGQKILSGNTVNTKSLNKDYFTEISKDEQKTIKLYSKNVEIMTSHPSDSYDLNLVNGNYQLTITDPSSFWSQSRYLVVVLE